MFKTLFRSILLGGLALIALAPLSYAAILVPSPPIGYVLDQAGIISQHSEATLEAKLSILEQETSIEIAVVTVTSLQGYEIEEFTIELAREWGVGQEEFDNGLVLLVAPNEREVRIEVGYGLEGVVTDYQSTNIIENVLIPRFRDGLYEQGIMEGVDYLEQTARGEEFDIAQVSSFGDDDFFFVFLAYFLPFLYIFMAFMSNSKAWWQGGLVGAFVGALIAGTLMWGGIGLAIGLLIDYILSTFFYKKFKMPKGGSGGSFGASSGGSSGGFGGGRSFGGGSSGGGGASGKW